MTSTLPAGPAAGPRITSGCRTRCVVVPVAPPHAIKKSESRDTRMGSSQVKADVDGETGERGVAERLDAKFRCETQAALERLLEPEPRADERVHTVVVVDRGLGRVHLVAGVLGLARDRRVTRARVDRAPVTAEVTEHADRRHEEQPLAEAV